MAQKTPEPGQQIAVNINEDTTPILYTDTVFITTNQYGVVLNIGQKLSDQQMRIVSRVGMSREHAKVFLQELGKLLALTEGHVQTGDKKEN